MKRILTLILIGLFLFIFLPTKPILAVSNLTVKVNPSLRYSLAEYDISFIADEDLIGGKDDIFIKFPEGTQLPCSCPHNWHLDFFSINGYKPSRAGKVLDIPNTMYLCVPGGITIKKGDKVEVIIKPQANIWNPSKPGKYQLILWTTKDNKAKSNFYEITSTTLKNVKVSVSPDTVGLIASYEINFTTGSKGNLSNGQNIYIQFPEGIEFPKVINRKYIMVNDTMPEYIEISGTVMRIKISHSINSNRPSRIVIKSEFGIVNPETPGEKSLFIWTDNEPEKIEAKFEIKSKYAVSTLVFTNPENPNGQNGFFITKPVITLKGETNTNNTVKTYYSIDNENDFTVYKSPFAIPDGVHTLYYYSEAGTIKEDVKSKVFKVDTVSPQIVLNYPDENPFYSGKSLIKISGKVSEKSVIIINEKKYTPDEKLNFEANVSLKPGSNLIKIICIDPAGNKTEKEVKVIFDTTVPELTIYSPSDWEEVKSNVINITGKVSPVNSEVYVNGEQVKVSSGGSFDYSLVPGKKEKAIVVLKIMAVYPLSKKSVEKMITVLYNPQTVKIVLSIGNKKAIVNGKVKAMDVAPFIDKHSGRTLVPVRFVVEFLGGSVSWDPETRTVTVIANGKTVKIPVGDKVAYINGKQYELDQPAIILHNRTFVPLRFVAEALGFKVIWNGKERTITIY